MDIFSINKLFFFLIFFMPGFVSIKVYDLFIASPSRDFSKALLEAIAYSVVNFALLSWIIWIMLQDSKGVIILGKDMSTVEFFTSEARDV